jgi:hypothetical protein
MKKWFFLLTSVFLLLGYGHLYYYLTGDFRQEYALSTSEVGADLSIPPLTDGEKDKLAHLLKQPFTYLGHGHQTYVFLGEDGETVLKIFMNDYLRSTSFKHVFPPIYPFRQWMLHKGEHRMFRLNRLLNGYRLAYTLDKQDSGLLFLHLNQENLRSVAVIKDGMGRKQEIELDRYVYAIQKKAELTKNVFRHYLSRGDVEGLKERIEELFALYRRQFEKGLVDRDRNIFENSGFIGTKAIRVDVGKVVPVDSTIRLDFEYSKIIHDRLSPWFERHYPQHAEELNQFLSKWGTARDYAAAQDSRRDKNR